MSKFSACLALVALAVPSLAQTDIVYYDPVGAVDELAGLPGIAAPGIFVTDLKAVGMAGGNTPDAFQTRGWQNLPGPNLSQYLEFTVIGNYVPGLVVFDWFLTPFGPSEMALRSSMDSFATDVATAPKTTSVTLDIAHLGSLSGAVTFRLYFYSGSTSMGSPSTSEVLMRGSQNSGSGIGLKLISAVIPDECADALSLPPQFGVFPYVAWGATTDGLDSTGACDYGTFSDEQNHNDIWFTYSPPVSGCTYISTLGLAGYDTRLTIYEGYSCPDEPLNIIACADDEVQPETFPFEAGLDVFLLAGQQYTIRLGTSLDSIPAQFGSLRIEAGPGADVNSGGQNPGAPDCIVGDGCGDPIVLAPFFTETPYDATGATTDGLDYTGFCDDGFGLGGGQQNYNDIWFSFTPTVGGCVYISTLGLAGYDTNLTVYQGDSCPASPADIIACADDEVNPAASPFEAGLDVVLVAGQTYLIRLGTQVAVIPAGTGVLRILPGPGAAVNSGGNNPGAPGCTLFPESCNGDGGDQAGCSDCPCMNNATAGTIGGCLNSAGTAARLIAEGDPSVSLPPGSMTDLRFSLLDAPPSAFCILNSGDSVAPTNMANPCFGLRSGAQSAVFDGLRCAVSNTRRHGGRSADVNGNVGFSNSAWGGEAAPPAGIAVAGGGFAAGQTRHFQVVNRDDPLLSCMRGLNTSQSVRVIFEP